MLFVVFSCQSEINDFRIELLVKKYILCFNISMRYTLPMHIQHSRINLYKNLHSSLLTKFPIIIQIFQQVTLPTKLHEDINTITLSHYLLNPHDILMMKAILNLDLVLQLLAVLLGVGEDFYCVFGVCEDFCGFVYVAMGTFA